MDIYTDYEHWKVEHLDLLNTLINNDSDIMKRIINVYNVLEHLYNDLVMHDIDLSEYEEYIFESGFNYLHDHIMTVETLLDSTFNKNILALEKCAKTVNLLLYVNDFEDELLNATDDFSKDMKELEDFEGKILQALEKHQNVEDATFVMLDEITIPMFKRHNLEINPVESIFYEIADTYNLIEEKEDIYTDFIQDKIDEDHGICQHHHHDCDCDCED